MAQMNDARAETNGQGGAYGSSKDAALTTDALKQIALRHSVCYEVWPEWAVSGGRTTRVGFSISLCGVHENLMNNDVPGCVRCWGTYSSLRRVAESILPAEERDCRFEVGVFDRAWHVAPSARHGRNETIVTISIFHRRNFHAPVDECQQQCLDGMRETLHRLGIRENACGA